MTSARSSSRSVLLVVVLSVGGLLFVALVAIVGVVLLRDSDDGSAQSDGGMGKSDDGSGEPGGGMGQPEDESSSPEGMRAGMPGCAAGEDPPCVAWESRGTGAINAQLIRVGELGVFGDQGGMVNAIDMSTGELVWSYETGQGVFNAAASDGDRVFVGDRSGFLYALDAKTGELQWQFDVRVDGRGDGVIEVTPAVDDGRVYAGASNGLIFAVDAASGELAWTLDAGAEVYSSPLVVDGTVYIGSNDPTALLYAIDATTGVVQWTAGASVYYSSPAADAERVYVGTNDGKLKAFNRADGSLAWEQQFGDNVGSSPTVVDGVVYVASFDGMVYAVNAESGKVIWSFLASPNNIVFSSPTVVNGRVYIGSHVGLLYGLDAEDGTELWNLKLGETVGATPWVEENALYIGGDTKVMTRLQIPD